MLNLFYPLFILFIFIHKCKTESICIHQLIREIRQSEARTEPFPLNRLKYWKIMFIFQILQIHSLEIRKIIRNTFIIFITEHRPVQSISVSFSSSLLLSAFYLFTLPFIYFSPPFNPDSSLHSSLLLMLNLTSFLHLALLQVLLAS